MNRWIVLLLVVFLCGRLAWADDLDVICFFPDKVDFDEVNKVCKKGDLIRTKPSLAEVVCDWDKQIFKYTEDKQEWVTCVYHGKPRQLKLNLESK